MELLSKMTSVPLTRILQLPPCLRYQREAPGQRLDQTTERGVGHQDHLLPVMLLEESLQDGAGGLRVHTLSKYAKLENNHVSGLTSPSKQ